MNLTPYDLAVLLSYIGCVAITYLSQLGIFGATNKEVSDTNPTPLTPAPWAFAIWGVIFTSQMVAVAYLLIRRDASLVAAKKRVTQVVGPWWALGWIAEAAWQFAFVKNTPASLVVSAFILLVAVAAFQVALAKVHAVTPLQSTPAWVSRLLVFSTSVNAAWLSVAAALGVLIAVRATTHVALVPIAIVLAVAIALAGAYSTYSRREPYYAGAMCWAFIGVYSEQVGAHPAVAGVLTGAILANAAALVLVVTGTRAPRPGAATEEVRQALVEDEG